MADCAAQLVDEILPHQPMRQWVLSVPFQLRMLFASQPAVMGRVLGIVYRAIATHLSHKAGFSLHAGVAVRARERKKLEHLCRYIARPAVSAERLSLTRNGRLRYELKTPWRDGTTHILFEPLDFIARLVALVPKPRVNLTRFHGVFAPNSKHRAQVTPAQRGKGRKAHPHKQGEEKTPFERRVSMTWAQRLKRVFEIEIETCCECGGDVRVIASIEDPVVISKILDHLGMKVTQGGQLPQCRAPPPDVLFA